MREASVYRVVDATQALASLTIAVSDGVGVNVVVAVALLASPSRTEFAHRVTKVPVFAEFTPWSGSSRGTLDTDGGVWIALEFEASSAVRTRARLAVVGGAE